MPHSPCLGGHHVGGDGFVQDTSGYDQLLRMFVAICVEFHGSADKHSSDFWRIFLLSKLVVEYPCMLLAAALRVVSYGLQSVWACHSVPLTMANISSAFTSGRCTGPACTDAAVGNT